MCVSAAENRGKHFMSDKTRKVHTPIFCASKQVIAVVILAVALPLAAPQAQAQPRGERSGKQVVDATCAACHAKGTNGAPRIGDKEAWDKRSKQGLTSLTKEALTGIRKMPGHGGDMTLTDLEIGRAITYMVNQSGGKWVEPASAKAMAVERSGKQIVEAQCFKCHQAGVDGAPKIGDRSAWIPRVSQGLDNVTRSAIRGHGGMPARGGMASLSDAEMRRAVVYMLNYGTGVEK